MSKTLYVLTKTMGTWAVELIGRDTSFQVNGSSCTCPGAEELRGTGEVCRHVQMARSHTDIPAPQPPMVRATAVRLAHKLMKKLSHLGVVELVDVSERKNLTVKKITLGLTLRGHELTRLSRLARIVYRRLPVEIVIY